MAAQQGDLEFIHMHNTKLLNDWEEQLGNIRKALPAQNIEIQQMPMDAGLLERELSKLKAAMIDFDTDEVNEITKNLQVFAQVFDYGDTLEKILQCKLAGNYDEAVLNIDEFFEMKNMM
jgi:hypothetical protein